MQIKGISDISEDYKENEWNIEYSIIIKSIRYPQCWLLKLQVIIIEE